MENALEIFARGLYESSRELEGGTAPAWEELAVISKHGARDALLPGMVALKEAGLLAESATGDVRGLTLIAQTIGDAAKQNGWHARYETLEAVEDEDGKLEHVISKLALIVSEASEAIEELRKGNWDSYVLDGKPEGYPVELADVVIRALDLAAMTRINIGAEAAAKIGFNAGRGQMHGKNI